MRFQNWDQWDKDFTGKTIRLVGTISKLTFNLGVTNTATPKVVHAVEVSGESFTWTGNWAGATPQQVECHFADNSDLQTLNVGQEVTIQGTVLPPPQGRRHIFGDILVNCELIDAKMPQEDRTTPMRPNVLSVEQYRSSEQHLQTLRSGIIVAERFWIDDDDFSDDGTLRADFIDAARNIPFITSFQIYSGTSAPTRQLATLPSVRELSFAEGVQITPSDVESLQQCASLEVLSLSGEDVLTDQLAEAVGKCTTLIALSVSHRAPLTDQGLVSLANLKGLQVLKLPETRISDEGCRSLRDFADLRQLILGSSQIQSNGLAMLGELPHLVDLEITKCDSAALQGLAALKHLRRLKIGPDVQITDPSFLSSMTSLEILDLHKNESNIDQLLGELGPLSRLNLLDVSITSASDTGLEAFCSRPHLQLQSINLGTTRVTDKGMTTFCQQTWPNLKSIVLQGTSITGTGVKSITNIPTLFYLDIRLTEVTRDESMTLLDSHPNKYFRCEK
ncbi:MAG: hypothetical protein R3C01_08140 [Planctomycetaceae bacterium]